MGARDPVSLNEASARMLKRELANLRRQFTNLQRNLSHKSNRRHEVPYGAAGRIRFLNNSSETMPAYGVGRITGGTAHKYLTLDKPSTTFGRLYLVNGSTAVKAGRYGLGRYLCSECHRFDDHYVLYDSGTGTPAAGESWGPKPDQWSLAKWHYGFTILGGNVTGSSLTACLQHQVNSFLFEATELISGADDTGSVQVLDGDKQVIVGMTETITNRTSVAIADEATGRATWLGGVWCGETWECP